MAKSIRDCQTPEELAEAISYHLKQGGMRRDYYDKTGLIETKFDEFETKRLYGVALDKYNEIRKLYPNLPALQIGTSDSLSGLAYIQQLCTSKQESLQGIIEVLKNWQKSDKTEKDFKDAKSSLPPITKTYEILCRSRGQCGTKTTDIIRWLGSASNDRSGYYPALLNKFASLEVIADLENWQEKQSETSINLSKDAHTSKSDSILGDTWTILGIPVNVKKLCAKLKSKPFFLMCILLLIFSIATYPLWFPLINKIDHSQTASTNIFADVSKDGLILRSNDFPWEIKKSRDEDGNILFTIVDRRGDATAISVVPDYPEYTVYQSWEGMVIKFTCTEDKISDFTINVKY